MCQPRRQPSHTQLVGQTEECKEPLVCAMSLDNSSNERRHPLVISFSCLEGEMLFVCLLPQSRLRGSVTPQQNWAIHSWREDECLIFALDFVTDWRERKLMKSRTRGKGNLFLLKSESCHIAELRLCLSKDKLS